jgi:hypothetical protein
MRTGLTTLMVLAAAAILAQRAPATTIAEVLANPAAYNGRSVVVPGTVAAALPVGAESGYNLRDGTAVITVVSRSAAPAVGSHLNVTGIVRLFREGGGAEDNVFPPALVESARSPAP